MKNFNKEELIYIRNLITKDKPKTQPNIPILIKKIDKMLEILENEKTFLWQFYWDWGRHGSIEGIFKATPEEVESIVGKEAYFGEVLGKHSEVYGTIEERDFEILERDPLKVVMSSECGFNPFDYIREEEE